MSGGRQRLSHEAAWTETAKTRDCSAAPASLHASSVPVRSACTRVPSLVMAAASCARLPGRVPRYCSGVIVTRSTELVAGYVNLSCTGATGLFSPCPVFGAFCRGA